MECYKGTHAHLLVVAVVCMPLILAVPFSTVYILMRGVQLGNLHSIDSLERVGSLYQRYKTDYLYWEAGYLFKVLLLVMVQVRRFLFCICSKTGMGCNGNTIIALFLGHTETLSVSWINQTYSYSFCQQTQSEPCERLLYSFECIRHCLSLCTAT